MEPTADQRWKPATAGDCMFSPDWTVPAARFRSGERYNVDAPAGPERAVIARAFAYPDVSQGRSSRNQAIARGANATLAGPIPIDA